MKKAYAWLLLAPAFAGLGSMLSPRFTVAEATGAALSFAGAALTMVVPLALASRARPSLRQALAIATLGAIIVAVVAVTRPTPPIAVVLVDAGLVTIAAALGGGIGRRIAHPGHLLPACAVAAAADVMSLLEGPTRAIVESDRALGLVAIGFAVPGTRFVAPALGLGDAMFLALVLGCAVTHGLGVVRVALLGALGLAIAGVVAARFAMPVPALVPMAAMIVLGVPRARKVRPEDRRTTVIASVVALAVAASVVLRRVVLG